MVGVDEGKTLLMRRLLLEQPGPGYCHFPSERDAEYFAQLTAEQRVAKHRKGRLYYEWQKTRPRNEAMDCRIYAHAALLLANPDWDSLRQAMTNTGRKKAQTPTEKTSAAISHRRPMRPRSRR